MSGNKRKNEADDSLHPVYSNKSRSRPSAEARVDPTYGQRSALPGLDDDTAPIASDEELNYDDGMDALAYLRAVRKEATGIPNLLVAPKTPPSDYNRDIYEAEPDESQGWYEDGAYLTASRTALDESDDTPEEKEQVEAQLKYFDSIIARYETLRDRLQQRPPPEALERLGSDRPTWVPNLNRGISQAWIRRMQTMDPKPAQIASMEKGSVLKLLRLLTNGTMLKRNVKVHVGISRWIWALLARLPKRGELTSEEIGVVRELGKKAVLIGMGLLEEKTWEEGMQEVEKTFDTNEGEEEVPDVVNEDEIDLGSDDSAEDGETGLPGMDDLMVSTPSALSSHPPLSNPEAADTPEKNGLAVGLEEATGSTHAAAMHVTKLPIDANLPGTKAHLVPSIPEDHEGNENAEEKEGSLEGIPGSLAAAKARLFSTLADQQPPVEINIELENVMPQEPAAEKFSPQWNTRTTVDMIITVAGESYGQRDLLEFRGLWIKTL